MLMAVVLLLPTSARAQSIPFLSQYMIELKAFLQLSDSQYEAIIETNATYNRLASEKQRRIFEVQGEINGELLKTTLDANAIGIRYVEIESICREMDQRASESRVRTLALLNPEQRNRLKLLEDALKLNAMVEPAKAGNLIGTPSLPPFFTVVFTASATPPISGPMLGSCPVQPRGNGDFAPVSPAAEKAR